MSVSGYLSIYNDWDLLGPALRSVLPLLDELVVVDGAYSWMAAFQERIGRDPRRSEPPVHGILQKLGIPVRYISAIWPNEIAKRVAGYRACNGRYILRVDADEIASFNASTLEHFFNSGAAVAEFEIPLYVAPGWVQASDQTAQFPRAAFLFDSKQISAEDHLQYLWLVLEADERPPSARRLPVFPDPVAFYAHLTAWRTPHTAIQRACFYVLNWHRKFGVPWVDGLQNKPLDDVATLLKQVPPQAFLDIMLGHELVTGHYNIGNSVLRAMPLSSSQEAILLPLHRQYQLGQKQLNEALRARPRFFRCGLPICIDLTDQENFAAIVHDGQAIFESSAQINAAKAVMHYVFTCSPWSTQVNLDCVIKGNFLHIKIPDRLDGEKNFVRRVIELHIWLSTGEKIQRFICR